MVLNVTFNNISVISWRSVLLGEETRGPEKNFVCIVLSNEKILCESIVYCDFLLIILLIVSVLIDNNIFVCLFVCLFLCVTFHYTCILVESRPCVTMDVV
jgi:hypothetical protein